MVATDNIMILGLKKLKKNIFNILHTGYEDNPLTFDLHSRAVQLYPLPPGL